MMNPPGDTPSVSGSSHAARRLRSRLILAASAVVLHLLPLWREALHPPGDPKFAIPQSAPTPAPAGSKDMREELINPTGGTSMAHVASSANSRRQAGGDLRYGGTREGHEDVAIYFSIRSPSTPGLVMPRAVVTRDSAARELRRFVRKVGNAVIFAGSGGNSGSSMSQWRSAAGREAR